MAWAPAVAPLTEVVSAVLVEMSLPLAFQAVTTRGGGRRVRGRGAAFQVWLISRALAPCSITVNMCVKLLEVINDASSHKAGVDEEFFGVPDDIQDAMSNGSSDGGGDNSVQVEGGIVTTS